MSQILTGGFLPGHACHIAQPLLLLIARRLHFCKKCLVRTGAAPLPVPGTGRNQRCGKTSDTFSPGPASSSVSLA